MDVFVFAQQCKRRVLQFAALVRLCADICKADARLLNTHDLLHIHRAHHAELLQHFGAAFVVCAAVCQHEKALGFRHERCKCHALDAFDALDEQCGANDECAAVAGGRKRIALALCQSAQADRHRALLFGARDRCGLILHRDDIRAVDDLKIGNVNIQLFRRCSDLLFVAG